MGSLEMLLQLDGMEDSAEKVSFINEVEEFPNLGYAKTYIDEFIGYHLTDEKPVYSTKKVVSILRTYLRREKNKIDHSAENINNIYASDLDYNKFNKVFLDKGFPAPFPRVETNEERVELLSKLFSVYFEFELLKTYLESRLDADGLLTQ